MYSTFTNTLFYIFSFIFTHLTALFLTGMGTLFLWNSFEYSTSNAEHGICIILYTVAFLCSILVEYVVFTLITEDIERVAAHKQFIATYTKGN